MQWLESLDVELFRLLNAKLSNPVFDAVMPFVSGNAFFPPLLVLCCVLLVWKGGARGVLCVVMLALALAVSDGLVCNTIKHAVGRDRPFLALPDVRCLVGKGGSGSLPSSHAANWFAATMVTLLYYRRSVWFMLPAAILVSFSRIYNGVHYPSDVLAGAVLGAGSAGATLWLADAFWRWVGQRWFPLWWQRMPSLLAAEVRADADEADAEPVFAPRKPGSSSLPVTRHSSPDAQWLRLGYVCLGVLLLLRLAYIASGTIQLEMDEAYQWVWSKHLALSYYSKPPLIAYTQFLGTTLWGDTAFGVRFFSPIIAATLGFILLRFFAREVNARAGFFLLLIITATPLASVGTVLMTIDPLSVLFWTAAMLAGWRAVQENSRAKDWLWVGLWMGLGFLSKYTELFQYLCWAVFFALWPPARKQLRRPGPYLALLVNLLCALPVLIWNAQHDWVTVGHVADDAGAGKPWEPTLRYVGDFLGLEFGLLNPVFFVATVWASIVLWRRNRHNPRLVYFFSMGAPLFLAYLIHSFHSRVQPNWIAPSVLPLFCMMVLYWDAQWRLGVARIKGWLIAGLGLGFTAVILIHNTDLITKVTGHALPVKLDPLHRVRQWDKVARVAGEAREELLKEGKPVFIIAQHYGLAGEFSFYLPEAREAVTGTPLVYCPSSAVAQNQFHMWPGYGGRKGENAIYIQELDPSHPIAVTIPARLKDEFESITDLGIHNVPYHGGIVRSLQLFACRGVK